MGFFDSLFKAIDESIESGKANYEQQSKWKQEEMDYCNSSKKPTISLEALIRGISIANLTFAKRQVDLKIKYNDNSSEEKNALYIERKSYRDQIDALKKGDISYEKDEDDNLDFIERYNSHRNRRVALCISYLTHPKSTDEGIRNALKILLMSPYCRSRGEIVKDYANLKERFKIYKTALGKDLKALDYCFYNHLPDEEFIPCDEDNLGERWYSEHFMYSQNCNNTMQYNDEMYGTHFQSLDFYKLSTKYDIRVAEQEDSILLEFAKLYLVEDENN